MATHHSVSNEERIEEIAARLHGDGYEEEARIVEELLAEIRAFRKEVEEKFAEFKNRYGTP